MKSLQPRVKLAKDIGGAVVEDSRFIISPSPHIRDEDSTQNIMLTAVLGLLPVWIAATYFFGFDSIRLVVISSLAAIFTEAACQKLRNRPITVWDGSALVTGMLLGLSVPPTLPSWMVIFGAFMAIAVGKQVFGGLGGNPFNPALVGRAIMVASFSGPMTKWTIDAVSQATPLAESAGNFAYHELFFGNIAGSIGETSALAILLGAIFLYYRGVLDYRLPLSYLGTVVVLSVALGQDPIFHLLAGGLLFAAVYMASDMVTTPVTPKGRWIFGIGAGIILVVIRQWGSLPEGVTYSILLMNAATPLINRFTRPRIYGRGVRKNG